ncbi:MAG: histidinol-phosphatase [Tyzzerella sp.]|nr:histidinol-phosphatase [Tyzzerella sp.]
MYLYETHLHSSECSACASSTAREMVRRYKEAGYAGFVLTNHFITGNTCVPKDISWGERMNMYYDAYLEAKDEAAQLDFDVFFGIEHHYGKGKEVLIYGIDLDFLRAHPEIETIDIDTLAQLVHEEGGIIIHAHPYRKRGYIPEGVMPRYDVCDGIEVYNGGDDYATNDMAYQDAVRLDKIMTSGGDVHMISEGRIGRTGNNFERRIRTMDELILALRNKEGCLLIDGKVL